MILVESDVRHPQARRALASMFEARKQVFVDLLKWDVPVIDDAAVSVNITDCTPVVLNVTAKVPTPALRLALAGIVAAPSVLVR